MDTRRFLRFLAIPLAVAALSPWESIESHGQPPGRPLATRLRRPVAAVLLADGHTVCVANHRSGTVSVVNLRTGQVTDEIAVGASLADLAALPDHKHLLAIDEGKNELVALSVADARPAVLSRLAVGPYPVSVAVCGDGARATVASLWSRRVEVIDLAPLASAADTPSLRVVHTIPLPFPPRLECALPGGSLVAVADAFGGRLAVVDATAGKLVAIHELAGHNLRGLAVSADGKELLISHQLLNQRVPTSRENIQSGTLMANVVRRIPIDRLTAPQVTLDDAGSLIRLGGVSAGAGDPAGVVPFDDGRIAVALAGVHEVALVHADGRPGPRIAVGRRPTALANGPDGQLVVVNTFADSLSLFDPRRAAVTRTIALGPSPPLEPKDRGELLFFDARLARDGWMSCHSCHTDGHANGLLADTLTDGSYGTPKRTLTLMDTRMTDPWGWNGQMKYLHDQVQQSLLQTMHADEAPQDKVIDLTTFLHTLPPPPPPEPVTADPADRERVERGRRVFEQRGCVKCHIPPLTYSSHGTYDVGFEDEHGLKKFNPPSLRGVGQGRHFFHDNRAATLAEVFTKFQHPYGEEIDGDELADLLRFLRNL